MGRKKKSITDRQLEVVSARVRFEIYREIEQIAKESELTMTQVVRRMLTEGVRAYRKKVA